MENIKFKDNEKKEWLIMIFTIILLVPPLLYFLLKTDPYAVNYKYLAPFVIIASILLIYNFFRKVETI